MPRVAAPRSEYADLGLLLFRKSTAVTALGAAVQRNEVALQNVATCTISVRAEQITNACFAQYAVNGALHGPPKRADRTVGGMRAASESARVSVAEIVSVDTASQNGQRIAN